MTHPQAEAEPKSGLGELIQALGCTVGDMKGLTQKERLELRLDLDVERAAE